MVWRKTPADRQRDAAVYGSPEYQASKRAVRKRSGGHCEIRTPRICNGRGETIDHITPVSRGGGHELANLRDACYPCHRAKTAQEGGGYRNPSPADPEPARRTRW